MKIQGKAGSVLRRRDGKTSVGRYVGLPNVKLGPVSSMPKSSYVCPLCEGELFILLGCGGRVSHIADDTQPVLQAIIDPLPSTHQALFCKVCRVGYTILVGG